MGSGNEAPAPLIESTARAMKKAAKPKVIKRAAAIRFIRHLHTKDLHLPRVCISVLLLCYRIVTIRPEFFDLSAGSGNSFDLKGL
jgi:hypothetical protein